MELAQRRCHTSANADDATYGAVRAWTLLGDLGREVFDDVGALGRVVRYLRDGSQSSRAASRELFPLPMADSQYIRDFIFTQTGAIEFADACAFISGVIGVLNFLYGVKCDTPLTSKIISVQKAVHDNIINKTCVSTTCHGR